MTSKLNTKLKTVGTAMIIAGVVGGVSMPVAAKKYNDYRDTNHSAYDYAKVVNVEPIFETHKVNNPVEQCWDEKVATRGRQHSNYNESNSGHNSPTGTILGAIIGGALGNQFGSGRGKKVATVAGAVLGASVGNDVKQKNRHRNSRYNDRYDRQNSYDRYEVVQRCELRDNYTVEERLVGYNVAYKYRDNVFHTEMDRDPGNKIKVRVTVDPV